MYFYQQNIFTVLNTEEKKAVNLNVFFFFACPVKWVNTFFQTDDPSKDAFDNE